MITKVDTNTANITRVKRIIIIALFRQGRQGRINHKHDLQRKYLEANSICSGTFWPLQHYSMPVDID